jgi:putative transposase
LVFVTKYRRGVIDEAIRVLLVAAAESVCTDFGATLVAADGEDDHLHLLVAYPPQVAVSRLVNSLKGVSARRVRAANPPGLRRKLWGDHFWSPSYFAATTGGASLETVKAYVEQQRAPGRKKTGPKPHSR